MKSVDLELCYMTATEAIDRFKSKDLSPGLLNYNYNVLMSLETNAVLLTWGDNDTCPIWMLQDALGVRTDVTILNVNLLSIPEYRSSLFSKLNIPGLEKEFKDGATAEASKTIVDHIFTNKPKELKVYTSSPNYKKFTEHIDNLYLVGCVLQYSEENIDNVALIQNNFENVYALDYVYNQFTHDKTKGIVERWMNVNYLPAIIKLYNHYKLSGQLQKAEEIKKLGLSIASKGGEHWKSKATKLLN